MNISPYDNMNSEEMRKEAAEQIAEIQAIIDANADDRKKEIGDRVLIWDGSGNKDKNTGEKRTGICPLFKTAAIVIATDQKQYENTSFGSVYHLDLLVVFPSGEEVYVGSQFVKRID